MACRSWTWTLSLMACQPNWSDVYYRSLYLRPPRVCPLPDRPRKGASFDRFGLFTSTAGGQMVKIYLDDLTYTARAAPP